MRVRTRALAREWVGGGESGKATPAEKTRDGGDAPGSYRHCIRVGMDSYQLPSVAYGSGRKPAKVLGMNPANPSPRGSVRGAARGEERYGDALGSCAH